MDARAKQLWITALRSGDYRQTRGTLHRLDESDFGTAGHCCLGVLCDVAIKDGVRLTVQPSPSGASVMAYDGHLAELPDEVVEWALLDGPDPVIGGLAASVRNDDGETFQQIADLIEKYL